MPRYIFMPLLFSIIAGLSTINPAFAQQTDSNFIAGLSTVNLASVQQTDSNFPAKKEILTLAKLGLLFLLYPAIKKGKQHWWKKGENMQSSRTVQDEASVLARSIPGKGIFGKKSSDNDLKVSSLLAAADQGEPRAQYELGLLYRFGALNDWAKAYKWLYLAKEGNVSEADKVLEELKRVMNQTRLEESEKLIEKWRNQHPHN